MNQLIIMNIKKIIIDSIKYPLLDWKKILILGLIAVVCQFPLDIISPFNLHYYLTYPFLIIALLINCFIIGYFFKIIHYSLKDTRELPKFSKWVNLFKNGFKVTCVSFIYSIPATLPLVILNSSLLNFYSHVPYFFVFIMDAAINHGYLHTIWFAYILYLLILFPISLIAIANMANNDGKWSYAFEFKVIFDKIKNIGWIKFYSWYLSTSVIELLIFLIGSIITMLSILIPTFPFGLIAPLILTPYIYIFFARSIALIYQSDNTI